MPSLIYFWTAWMPSLEACRNDDRRRAVGTATLPLAGTGLWMRGMPPLPFSTPSDTRALRTNTSRPGYQLDCPGLSCYSRSSHLLGPPCLALILFLAPLPCSPCHVVPDPVTRLKRAYTRAQPRSRTPPHERQHHHPEQERSPFSRK